MLGVEGVLGNLGLNHPDGRVEMLAMLVRWSALIVFVTTEGKNTQVVENFERHCSNWNSNDYWVD